MRPIQTRISLVLGLGLLTGAAGCANTASGGYPADDKGGKDASVASDASHDPTTDDSGIDPIGNPPGDDAGTTEPGPVSLPFFVSDQFVPSGFMGDSQVATNGIALSKDPAKCKTPRVTGAGGDCYSVTWTSTVASGASSWAGVYWQYPADNWGAKPGKPITAGATKVTFSAAGQVGGEKIQLCAGGINTKGNEPSLTYRDKFSVQQPAVTLTTDWATYEISLEGTTYDSVLGAFCWVTSATTSGSTTFYIDNLRWE